MRTFINAKFAGMYFVYVSFDGNSRCIEGISASKSRSETALLTCVETVHRNLRESAIIVAHALVGREDAVYAEEEKVLDIEHDNPSTSTRQISSPTGHSQSGVLHENQSYPFLIQPAKLLQPGEKRLHLQFSQ